jgi:hypothetical protein
VYFVCRTIRLLIDDILRNVFEVLIHLRIIMTISFVFETEMIVYSLFASNQFEINCVLLYIL